MPAVDDQRTDYSTLLEASPQDRMSFIRLDVCAWWGAGELMVGVMMGQQAYRLWGIVSSNTDAVKEETDLSWGLALTLTEDIHQFLELRLLLDLEGQLTAVAVANSDCYCIWDRGWRRSGVHRASR